MHIVQIYKMRRKDSSCTINFFKNWNWKLIYHDIDIFMYIWFSIIAILLNIYYMQFIIYNLLYILYYTGW